MYNYNAIDMWILGKSEQLKNDKIDLIVSFVNNGIFPGLSASKSMNLELLLLTAYQKQIQFPQNQQISNILAVRKKQKNILLCFDNINENNQSEIQAVLYFLKDLDVDSKIMTLIQSKNSLIIADYIFEVKEQISEKAIDFNLQMRNFI